VLDVPTKGSSIGQLRTFGRQIRLCSSALRPRVTHESIMDIVFEPASEIDGEALLAMAHAFHDEDGHPLDSMGEAAVLQIARGEPFARAWIVRNCGAAVGYVVITLGYSIEYGGRDGFIDDLNLVSCSRRARPWIGQETAPIRVD
jgi:hypothetical protein